MSNTTSFVERIPKTKKITIDQYKVMILNHCIATNQEIPKIKCKIKHQKIEKMFDDLVNNTI